MADENSNPLTVDPTEVLDPDRDIPGLPKGDQTNVLVDGSRLVPQNNPWDNPNNNYVTGEAYEGTAKALTNTLNSNSWISQLRSKSPSQYDELVGYLRAANMISDRTVDPGANTVADATRALLTEAGAAGQEFYAYVKGRYGDPIFLEENGLDGASGPGGGGIGRAPRMPSYTETVRETNEMDANVLLNNAMQQSVGRDATDAEVQAFTRILQGEAEANPDFVQSNPVGMNDAKNRTGGGINTELLAAEFADGTPGAPEYKMATEGMEALEGWFAKKIGAF